MRAQRPNRSRQIAFLAAIGLLAGAAAGQGRIAPAQPLQPAQRVQPAPATPASQPAAVEQPAAEAAVTGAAQAQSEFSEEEVARLTAVYTKFDEAEQAEMRAWYEAMGVDLLVALGMKDQPPAPPPMPVTDAVRALNFARAPAAVLAARSKLGFGDDAMPDDSDSAARAEWLHTRVLAGEWGALGELFEELTPAEATDIYSHILRSTNEGGGGLLPEEVLVLGDACPGEMADWQLDVLAKLLKDAASQYGAAQFLAHLNEGSRLFGVDDDAMRQRTVRLLIGAGMAQEAAAFLPPLEEARAAGAARIIFAHGRYHEDLGKAGRSGAEAEEHLRRGWALLGEVAMLESAQTELRMEAMRRAIHLLPEVTPAQATEWLGRVFVNPALGAAALEVITLQAMTIRDQSVDAARRAQNIATIKAAVDTLLAREDVDLTTLRVPLRMLTTALADEVDAVVKEKGRTQGVAPEAVLLHRAAPDERWLAALEPSVALRGYRASIAIATIIDETDVALDVLASAVRRYPDAGADLASEFLKLWEGRLNPSPPQYQMNYFYYYGPQGLPSAPLTRGRQHRNLDRLERVLVILEEMGVQGRELPAVASAFRACHARTEVYDRGEITRIFGPLDQMQGPTAAALAESMRTGLGGDWRSRQAQQAYGMMRSQAEIADLVEEGYELAIELADRALTVEPDSWRHAVLKAALNYDRVRFKQSKQKQEFAEFNEYRRQAFDAFEQAAMRYADLVARGQEHDSSNVYLQWFSAVLDAGQPVDDSATAAAEEREVTEDQVLRIGEAMRALPQDAYQRHIGAFAGDLIEALGGAPPERKPEIVRAGMQVVGDHPAGAPLQRLNELYEDLVSNEIRLRLTIDGSDTIGAGDLFGLTLTLRYTNSVDRETGGFDKYLYQDSYVRIGNQYRSVNYQAQIRRGIENALSEHFTIESLGFFEPLTPSREVREDGELGWQEKPLAYIVLKANDPSVDRIPQITFDMHFDDQLGPVTLPILSNTPPIDATGEGARRPLKGLQVTQTVDVRRLQDDVDDRAVTIEVHARGEGVIPGIHDLLDGVEAALPGYACSDEDIEARPYTVIQTTDGRQQYYYMPGAQDEDKIYATADEDGIFRLATERSWMVTLRPASGAVGDELTLPRLAEGVDGELVSRHYADMDIVEVAGGSIPIDTRWSMAMLLTLGIPVLLVAGAGGWLVVRRRVAVAGPDDAFALPDRITPLSTIAALQRIAREGEMLQPEQRRALHDDIAAIERGCFGPQNGAARPDQSQMQTMLQRWAAQARPEN